jgi:two-component system chemotaxis response regulator CheB
MNKPSREPFTTHLIGIASSACGLEPLETIVGSLPHGFPAPIVVLPSIHPENIIWLVARLNAKSRLQVVAAEDGHLPLPGCIYVASDVPGLRFADGRIQFQSRKSDCYFRVKDALFCSMAWDLESRATAVILDGLGPDGAEGMKEVRDAGGYTIAQDRSTSMIYGTAKWAEKMSAAREFLPVQEIGPRLVALVASDLTGVR